MIHHNRHRKGGIALIIVLGAIFFTFYSLYFLGTTLLFSQKDIGTATEDYIADVSVAFTYQGHKYSIIPLGIFCEKKTPCFHLGEKVPIIISTLNPSKSIISADYTFMVVVLYFCLLIDCIFSIYVYKYWYQRKLNRVITTDESQ